MLNKSSPNWLFLRPTAGLRYNELFVPIDMDHLGHQSYTVDRRSWFIPGSFKVQGQVVLNQTFNGKAVRGSAAFRQSPIVL